MESDIQDASIIHPPVVKAHTEIKSSKNKTCRSYICTRHIKDFVVQPNIEEYLSNLYKSINAQYVCGQLELSQETQFKHIQFYVYFSAPQRMSKIRNYDPKIYAIPCLANYGADSYCIKVQTRIEGPFEFGKKPEKLNTSMKWDEIKHSAIKGNYNEIPSNIFVRYYSNLKQIRKDHLIPKNKTHLRGIWIYGPSGSGKSRYVHDCIPSQDLYPKQFSKWWDNYNSQKFVVLDDFGPQEKNTYWAFLKIWADYYGILLETKGGCCTNDYEYFIITSQYSIQQIYGQDQEQYDSIKRRYKEYFIDDLLANYSNLFSTLPMDPETQQKNDDDN